jgi:arginine decarboxylase
LDQSDNRSPHEHSGMPRAYPESTLSKSALQRIDQFFNGPSGRADNWRDLVEAAKAWAAGTGNQAKYTALLNDISVIEKFHGYPGLHLMAALKEASGDAATSLGLATRITHALMTRMFRQHAGNGSASEDGDGSMPELVPSTLSRAEARRLYFETLIVTGVPATSWQGLANECRELRRPLDAFVYEPGRRRWNQGYGAFDRFPGRLCDFWHFANDLRLLPIILAQ